AVSGSDRIKSKNFWKDYADSIEGVDQYEINLEIGEVLKVPARLIWKCIVDGAWRNGEPGLYMYDIANEKHSFDVDKYPEHKIEATNPCGEQPLENYESCNLGHVNLSLMVKDTENGKGMNFIDWKKQHTEYNYEDTEELREAMEKFLREALRLEKFKDTVKTGTRFLDDVIDMNNFPLKEIEEKTESMRKVGLGLMGFAQMLIQIGIRYGSDESVACAEILQKLITKYSVEESHRLAEERGKFDKWEESKWNNPTRYPEWFRKFSGGLDPEDYKNGFKIRNHSTTTIAPTGSTSMIANTSGGCEPIFSLAYFKNVASDVQGKNMLVEFDDYFLKSLKANNVDVEKVKEEAKELMNNNEWKGIDSISDELLPPKVKNLFATTDTINPEGHVRIQAAFQKYNHSGISKTCNFPNDATREDISNAFELAYDLEVKGLTVYRDGSRDVQVMTTRKENKLESKEDILKALIDKYDSIDEMLKSEEFLEAVDLNGDKSITIRKGANNEVKVQRIGNEEKEGRERRKRPNIIQGSTQKIETGQGSMFVTINEDSEGLFEVFASIGKSGGFTSSFTEAVGRLVSLALRSGIDPWQIIDELKGIRSPKMAWDKGAKIIPFQMG
ncbi:MAG: adenosylcobalamin-dependent ribonucleoside-diphosphate reductase, partial [Candidatus Aenigmatarchaeota archaeon]